MEACEPPFSARAVAALRRETDAGTATVKTMCRIFGISESAWYASHKWRECTSASPSSASPSSASPSSASPSACSVAPTGPTSTTKGASSRRPTVSADALLAAITVIVAANPAWGVRKVWAVLRRAPHTMRVSHRRVYAVRRAAGLCLARMGEREEVPRLGTVATTSPNRRWATDLTTVWTKEDGLVAVVPVVDCGCRSVLAVAVTKSQDTSAVLAPLREALASEFGDVDGVPDGLEVRTDHGPQYTGADCEVFCGEWSLDHTLAPIGRPTGNAVAERVIRTMKEECIWLRDWRSATELHAALVEWQRSYNDDRPHQSLSWRTPSEARRGLSMELKRAA
jgi:putative transposase